MKKYFWVTNLRVLATLTVIMLHTAGGIYRLGSIPNSWWWTCNLTNSFGRFAVPVFFMLSGYLLLSKYDGDLETFLKKRLIRIFIPFVIWTGIYMLWGIYFGFPSERTKPTITEVVEKFFIGGAGGSGHLWFIYTLLGLYAFTPYMSKWLKQASRYEINFFLILWFISSAVYPYITYFFDFQIKFELRYFSGYLGYFVLGYYLGNREFPFTSKQIAIISIIGFVASWLITASGIYVFTARNQNVYDSVLFDYLSPSVIMMSISMFLLFKNALNVEFAPKIINQLDAASYGMYLLHLIPMRYISRQYQINYTWYNPVVGMFTQFLITTVICFAFTFIVSKLPKGHWITG